MKRLTITLICLALLFLPSAQGDNVTVVNAARTVGSTNALQASNVFNAAPGDLISFHCYNANVSNQFILIINAKALPADGNVELLYPPIRILAVSTVSLTFPVPLHASKGIVVCNSSTGGPTKTIGLVDCFFKGQIKP